MAKHAAPRPQYRWWIPVTVVIAAAVLVSMIIVNDRAGTDDSTSAAGGQSVEPEVVVTEVEDPQQADVSEFDSGGASDPMSDGPADAPVTLVVFSDYQCPYCAAWSQETLPTMLDYVDSGDLRIEWREVNVFGSASVQAAKAAYAAALQDRHWDFHQALFADGEPRSPDQLTPQALTAVAEELGLDIEQFTEDMNAQTTAEAVEENAKMGTELGAFSTPTFILDGEPYVGAQPTEVFVDAIDTATKGQN